MPEFTVPIPGELTAHQRGAVEDRGWRIKETNVASAEPPVVEQWRRSYKVCLSSISARDAESLVETALGLDAGELEGRATPNG
jgi:hypothetical protein